MRVDASPATDFGSRPGCHSTTPCPSTSMPRRPARPVSWVYSPGVMSAWVSPFHFDSFSITTERAGMLIPSARVSVAKTTRHSPRRNSSSTHSLNVGSIPAWWAATPRVSAVEELVVAEHLEVLLRDVGAALLHELVDLVALLGRGQPQVGVEALLDRRVAARPG